MKLSKDASLEELQQIMLTYDVRIHRHEEPCEGEDPDVFYVAYFADIEVSPCSSPSDTAVGAVHLLLTNYGPDMFEYFRDHQIELPEATKSVFFMNDEELKSRPSKVSCTCGSTKNERNFHVVCKGACFPLGDWRKVKSGDFPGFNGTTKDMALRCSTCNIFFPIPDGLRFEDI